MLFIFNYFICSIKLITVLTSVLLTPLYTVNIIALENDRLLEDLRTDIVSTLGTLRLIVMDGVRLINEYLEEHYPGLYKSIIAESLKSITSILNNKFG